MADLEMDYNAEEHKALEGRDPVPPGTYEAMLVKSEVKPTNKGGTQLSLQWKIISGEHEKRLVFDHVTLKNNSPKAVEFGKRQLSSICRACGKLKIKDSGELHSIPCKIKVRIKPAQGDYAAGNAVTDYKPINAPDTPSGQAAGRSPSPSSSSVGAGATGGGSSAPAGAPPWKR